MLGFVTSTQPTKLKSIYGRVRYVTHPTLNADFDGFYTVSNKSHERCFFILNPIFSAILHQFGLFYQFLDRVNLFH